MRRGLLMLILVAGCLLLGAAPTAATTGWTWPLSPRPVVVHPFVAPAGPYAAGHRGVDLGSLPGAPVLAAGPGVVAFAGRVAGRGVVSVDHPGGLRTTYEPVAATVDRGDRVTSGSVLGRLELMGSHCLPATCLHWGLRRGSIYLDPLSLLGAVHVRLLPVWDLDPGDLGPRVAGTGAGQPPAPRTPDSVASSGSTGRAAAVTTPRPAAVITARPAAVTTTRPAAVTTRPAAVTTRAAGVAGLLGTGLALGVGLLPRIRRPVLKRPDPPGGASAA